MENILQNNNCNGKNENKILMLFARHEDGLIKSVYEVENGNKCGCVCANCGNPVESRQGEINAWHFAHTSEAECDKAGETALHKAGKQIVADEMRMVLPEIYVDARLNLGDDIVIRGDAGTGSELITFNRVDQEVNFGDCKPDLVCYNKAEPFYIEIAVTHFVDSRKDDIIKKSGVPTIEIDISHLLDESKVDMDILKRVIVDSTENKKWINTRHLDVYFKKAVLIANTRLMDHITSQNNDSPHMLMGYQTFIGKKSPYTKYAKLYVAGRKNSQVKGTPCITVMLPAKNFDSGETPSLFPRPIDIRFQYSSGFAKGSTIWAESARA